MMDEERGSKMNQAVTIGMIVWASVATIGVIALIGVVLWLLSIFADAFKR